ncbi:MAG: T9SS type A sorting domain-containing protein [Ferruginibacter sp.]
MQKFTGTQSENKIDLAFTKWLPTMRRLFVIAFFLLGTFVSQNAKAQFSPVPVTGFNSDVVADGTTNVDATSTTTEAVDATTAGANFVFVTSTFRPSAAASACGTAANSWPATITSSNTTTNTGITYSFQSAVGNNSLKVFSGTPADLTLVTPTTASSLYVVCLGGSGATNFTAKINFSDATSETVTSSAPDWCGGAATNKLPNATSPTVFYRIVRTATTCTGATCQYMYEMPLAISPANYLKTITSVTFTNTGGSGVFLHILAMGKKATCVVPADGPTALTQGATTSGSIAASFTAAASTPTGYVVVRYPSGATPVTPVNGTTYVANQPLGTGMVIQASASTSFTASTLSSSTTYDFYVYGYNSGGSCGGPIYNTANVLTGSFSTPACSGLAGGTYTVGTSGTYPTITAALTAINGGITGPIILELQSTYNSSGETFPITFPYNACIGPVNTLTIRPEAGATNLSITSNNTTGTINFNGASYVTIDGRPGGIGTTSQLSIANTNAGTSYALNFTNDANNNTVKYCTVTSRNTSVTSGTIVFGAGGAATGNDNNTIDNCSIKDDGTGNPVNAIYSSGTSAAIDNSNNTVSNNLISNYFSATLVSSGILLSATGNSGWTITNNRLFQTATRIYTSAQTHNGISIGTGAGYTITGNIIGFANSTGTGTTNLVGNSVALTGTFPSAYTTTGTANATRYIAINCAFTAGGTNSLIQSNTIAGFALFTSSGATTTNGIWCAINLTSGNATIGGATAGLGNTIGATTGQGSVYTAMTTGGGVIVGIYATSANTVTIANNTMGGLDASGTTATLSGAFTGIDVAGAGIFSITNNTLGNSTASNIRTGYLFTSPNLSNTGTLTSTTGTTSPMLGIRHTATGATVVISNNTLRGWANSSTAGGALTGITTTGAVTTSVTINGNALGTSGLGWMTWTVANTGGTVTGISATSATSATTHSIQNNDFNGIVYSVSGTSAHTYINLTGATAAANATTISNNTFTNLNVNTTGNVTFISHSYAVASTSTQTINNNSIVTAFNKAGAGGTVACMSSSAASATGAVITHTNNNFSNITVTGATAINGIANAEVTNGPTRTVTGNSFNSWTGGSSAITAISYQTFGGSSTVSNNSVTGITSQAAITALNIGSTIGVANPLLISNNTINTLTSNGTGGAVTGISCNNASSVVTITGHSIFGLSSTGAAAVNGISVGGATATSVFKNSICNLSGTNAGSTVNGILVSGGTAVTVYNNRIAALTTPAANATNPLNGLNITGGTTVNAYYNSIVLSGTSTGAAFGSSAVSVATGTTVNLRNNIFVNNTTPVAALAVAYRRSTTTLTSYAATSNNNLFYAGTPGASNLIFYDGTNSDQTLSAFKGRVAPRDGSSVSENPPFLSTTCGDANFLKVSTATPTLLEGTGAAISGFTDDFEGDTRNASTPDIGADEFSGTSILVVVINSVSTNPVGTQCAATARTITANVTAGSSNITTVTLNYQYNGGSSTQVVLTGGNPNAGQTSDWTGTLPAATPVNATVTWYVTATDAVTSKVTPGTSYADAPLTGVTPAATASPATICSGSAVVLTSALNKPTTAVLGAGGTATSTAGSGTFLSGAWGGQKTQYIVRASELTAAGLIAGNITSLAFETTNATAGSTYQGFNVSLGNTTNTTAAFPLISTGLTQVFRGTQTDDGYTPVNTSATNVNTLTFGTGTGSASSFAWDGTSNVVISICWSKVPTASSTTGTTVKVDGVGFTAQVLGQKDGTLPSVLCPFVNSSDFGTSTTSSNRPKFTFVGNAAPAITSVSWSDGTGVVGTTNPLTVNPTNVTAAATTVTYTATITAAGCTATATTNVVTVNPLPAPPNANNSTQCGVGVPACFVTTGGSNGTFKWYSAQTGGTLLQNGGGTYTTSISSTQHFWVSETGLGCESNRVEVIASVSAADPVQANVDNNNICLNTAISLSATQTPINPLTPNTYTYSWSATPASGSGIPTTLPGNPVSVTPTASGTYTYTVTANDATAGCTNTSTVVVTVKVLPVIASTTATPSTICAGVNSTLNGSGLPQYFNIPVTGYNSDVVANGTGVASSSTTGDLDGQNTLVASDWNFSGACTALTNFMPVSGQVTGNATIVGGALTYILQPYNTNNALRIPTTGGGAGSGTLTLTTPTSASKIFLLYIVGNGPITGGVTVTVNFTDATSQVISGLTGLDWFSNPNPAIANVGRINRTTAACQTTTGTAGGPNLHDLVVTLSAGNTSKLIQSITIQVTTTGTPTMAVMGVGGFRTSVPYNWSWNPGSLSGSSVIVNPTSTTTYTATATDPATTCSSTATVTVNVNPLPPAPSGSNGTDQCGTAITDASVSSNNTIDPQSPPFFKWYNAPTGGTVLQSGTSQTYTTPIGVTTDFYVSEVSANGCEGPRVHITTIVSDADPITVTATPSSICLNTSTDISASYSPLFNSYATYTLTVSPLTGSGLAGPVSLTVNGTGDGTDPYTVTPTATGTYTYTITANDPDKNCTAVNTVIVTVKPNPVINTATATPATVCAGVSSTLAATGGGTYSWVWNPGNLSGSSVTVTPSVTSTYTATATLNGCSTNSGPVTVTVNQLPAAPSSNDPVSRCGPGSVTLTATGSGGTLNWYNVASGGTSLQTGGSYTTNVSASTSFWVAETSAAGCAGPRTQVHVNITTPPTLVITAGGPTSFCAGNSVTLNGATGSDVSYTNFGWSANPSTGAGLSSASGASITVTPTVAGTYTITLTANDGNAITGCVNITTIVVTVNPNPVVSNLIANPGSVCSGSSTTLTGQPAYLNVPVTGFNVDAVANGTGAVTASTTGDLDNVYTLAAIDWNYDGSCAALTNYMPVSGTVNANSTVASGLVYKLQSYSGLNTLRIPATGTGTTGTGTLTLTTPTKANTLYLLYGAGNGPITSGITVTVTFTDASTQVFSNLTALDWFNTGGTHAIQDLGRVNAGTLACQTTTTGGPRMFDMTLALSAANTSKFVQSIKIDKTITTGIMNIWAVGMKSDPQISGTVNWSWNPGNLSGNPVTVTPAVTTTYTATATAAATGCTSTNTVTVTVGTVTATATATPSTPICAGAAVTLNAGAVGTAPLSYSWASTPAGSYPAASIISVTPAVTTTYTVTVTDACLGTTTSTVTVTVNPLPTASIQEASPISICSPATQTLHAVTDAGTASYQWTLNGTNIAGATSSTYTVSGISTGAYRVIVTNTTTNCVSAVSSPVIVTINYTPTGVTAGASTSVTCNGTPVNLTSSADAFPSSILTQNFESGIGSWTIVTTSAASTGWALQTNPYTSANSTPVTFNSNSGTKFLLANADIGGSGTSINTIVTSPVFSTMNYTSLNLAFNHYYKFLSSTEAFVEVSTNGSTWTTVKSYTANQGGPAAFAAESINLNAYINNPSVQVRFRYQDGWSWYWAIDDIAVTGAGVTYSYNWISNPAGFTSTAQNPTGVTPSTTTTYSVTVSTAAGCSTTTSTTVTVNPRPTGVISGSTSYCNGQPTTTSLSIALTGAGPWSGTLSPGAIPFSGSSSPITVSVTPSSTTTYTIATLNGSQCSSIAADLTGSATVTINPLPATPTITPAGPVTQCGGTVTLTASTPGAWQWNLEGSPIGGANNQTLVVSASGNYSVTVTNEFGCSATSAVTSVTINPLPATPTISAGGPITFCEGGSVTLTSSSATNNQWNLNGSPIGGATNSTLVVTASGDYTVTVTNGFGCTATSAITTVTVNPLAANPTASVVQPTCALGTGTINVTAPLGAGNTYSIGGPFQSSPSFPGVSPGTYTVYVQNSAGCFSPATTNVTVNPQPFVPGAPVVTGIVNVCPFIGVNGAAGQLTYTATATGFGTQTFNWVVPPTLVTIVSGQGTPNLVLSFQNGFATQPNKQIRLTVTNQCGTSTMTIYYLAAQIPNTPAPIVGPTDACPLLGGPAVAYTITKAPGAKEYFWSVPAGASFTHPNGLGVNDTTILVSFTAGYATGPITVQSSNDCGVSGIRSLTVTRIAPSQPNIISGPTNACPYITPNAPATYTVPAVPGVTYQWSASNGAVLSSAQGSNTMTVSYPIGYTGGTISVTATTGCGTSAARNLTITTLNPATPSVPDIIQTHFCGEVGGRKFTYTLSSMPANATSVVWTVPAGATFINLSPISIEVTYPDAAVNGVVTVQATNPCANSVIRSVNVKLSACPTAFAGTNAGTNGTAESKGEVKAAKATTVAPVQAETMEVKIFPNPTVSDFKLEVLTSGTEEITVRVLDNLGRLYKNFKLMPNQIIALGAELKAGSYLVEVRQGKTVKTTKVIKF